MVKIRCIKRAYADDNRGGQKCPQMRQLDLAHRVPHARVHPLVERRMPWQPCGGRRNRVRRNHRVELSPAPEHGQVATRQVPRPTPWLRAARNRSVSRCQARARAACAAAVTPSARPARNPPAPPTRPARAPRRPTPTARPWPRQSRRPRPTTRRIRANTRRNPALARGSAPSPTPTRARSGR